MKNIEILNKELTELKETNAKEYEQAVKRKEREINLFIFFYGLIIIASASFNAIKNL